jgi:hypothetical protein
MCGCLLAACGGSATTTPIPPRADGGSVPPPTTPSCDPAAGGGSATVAEPTVLLPLADRFEEAWLGSPAVADLDGDGENEIIVARDDKLVVWNATGPKGTVKWSFATSGRIWSAPVVADFRDDARLEVAIAARGQLHLLDAAGQDLSGFPVSWDDELRSLAAGDVDHDGQLDLVVATTNGGPGDVVNAFHASGAPVAGFPPLASGTSGCDATAGAACYFAGAYDQNLALGDLDGQGGEDIVVPHDNAYTSIFHGTGVAFDAAAGFSSKKTPGVRYLHDLAEAQQGFADDEATALQAHFTNTAPAIADVNQDGRYDVVLLGSVQNAAQDMRKLGVGLWVVESDASRLAAFVTPVQVARYVAGLEDLEGNIVGATNQVTVADLDATHAGLEMLFAGFDGSVHAFAADGASLWSFPYTDDPLVLTAGVAVADLSGDGIPEVVFASYSQDENKSHLFVLDAGGNLLWKEVLPHRGAMAVPTIADVNGDAQLELVVSLKDADDQVESVRVYTVAGARTNCLLWPTGRANLLRNGWVP